jgi:hypothetical protein
MGRCKNPPIRKGLNMSVESLLAPPPLAPPTLRLLRCPDRMPLWVLSETPLYMASHWRNGRSYPCTATLFNYCLWCRSHERREPAYIGVLIGTEVSKRILEVPPRPLLEIIKALPEGRTLLGATITPRRHSRYSPIMLDCELSSATNFKGPRITPADILRTLAKVYGLPDPLGVDPEAWTKAVMERVTADGYNPSTKLPPAE